LLPLAAKPGSLLAALFYEVMEMKSNHSWLNAILFCLLESTLLPGARAADLPVNWTELPKPFHTPPKISRVWSPNPKGLNCRSLPGFW
jgi:hypothetical protein